MSFEEKSSWVSTLALLVVSVWYFGTLWPVVATPEGLPGEVLLGPTVVAVVVLVVLQIGGHLLAAISGRVDGADERDRWIALRATRLADLVMGLGVLAIIGHLLTAEIGLLPLPSAPATIAYLLMAALVASELTGGVARIVGYRFAA